MSRTTKAFGVAMFSLVLSCAVLFNASVPYVLFSPGVTVNVLGTLDENGKQIIEIEGAQTFGTSGEFRMTTVSSTTPERRVLLWEAVQAWFDPDVALLPFDAVYKQGTTREAERSQSRVEMVASQDTAIAATLEALGYKVVSFPEIFGVSEGLPADKKLRVGDRIVRVQGKPASTPAQVTEILKKAKPGDVARFVLQRGSTRERVELKTVSAPDDPQRAVVGITVGTGFKFPITVRLNIPEQIGGPSAGLIFALSLYDTLTPGALNGGLAVAGTGTLDRLGNVGPIGGIAQKISASQAVGVSHFLVPAENCDEARTAPEGTMRLIKVGTLREALTALSALRKDPKADLPGCEETPVTEETQ